MQNLFFPVNLGGNKKSVLHRRANQYLWSYKWYCTNDKQWWMRAWIPAEAAFSHLQKAPSHQQHKLVIRSSTSRSLRVGHESSLSPVPFQGRGRQEQGLTVLAVTLSSEHREPSIVLCTKRKTFYFLSQGMYYFNKLKYNAPFHQENNWQTHYSPIHGLKGVS